MPCELARTINGFSLIYAHSDTAVETISFQRIYLIPKIHKYWQGRTKIKTLRNDMDKIQRTPMNNFLIPLSKNGSILFFPEDWMMPWLAIDFHSAFWERWVITTEETLIYSDKYGMNILYDEIKTYLLCS